MRLNCPDNRSLFGPGGGLNAYAYCLGDPINLSDPSGHSVLGALRQKAVAAIEGKRFADEITPILIPQRKGSSLAFATDEQPRAGTTAEALAKMRPALKKDTWYFC